MRKNKVEPKMTQNVILHYFETLTDTAREPILILDSNLKVLGANQSFYKVFKVLPRQTEKRFVYMLGSGQWDIKELRKLLEDILPKKKIITDFDVVYNFPKIGKKTMRLNARQIDSVQLIVLAFEDITAKKKLEEKIARYTEELEERVTKRTEELEDRIKELKELSQAFVGRELKIVELKRIIADLEKKVKKINHIPIH